MKQRKNLETKTGISYGSIVGQKYKLEEQIGRGSFGTIWKCLNIENNDQYAVKFEKRVQKQSSMLVREIKVMMEMKEEQGFARLLSYGKDEEHNFVIMSYMGRNMDSMLKKCNGRFSTQTLCNVAQQMINRLEQLHSKNLIHRDIKPDNYVIGWNQFQTVHLIDFGLAKYYKDNNGNHIPYIKKRGMIGTARYASINAHLGHEQSRRDDLEGLGYVLLYFTRGKLPWQSIQTETKEEKYEKIKNMKQNSSLEQLCDGVPSEFILYFKHVQQLQFTDDPDYNYLKSLFKKILADKSMESSDHVDWESLPEFKQKKKKFLQQQQIQMQKAHNETKDKRQSLQISKQSSETLSNEKQMKSTGHLNFQARESTQKDQLQLPNSQKNTLIVPNNQSNNLGTSQYSQISMQYSVQGGEQSNTSKMNVYQSSQVITDEGTPAIDKMCKKMSDLSNIKSEIRRQSEKMSLQDVIHLEETKRQELQQKASDTEESDSISEEMVQQYLGENISNIEPTIAGQRKVIKILPVQLSYKNDQEGFVQ